MATDATDFLEMTTAEIRGLHPYQPGKPVEELQRELGLSDIIKLASNENLLAQVQKSPQACSPLSQNWRDIQTAAHLC